MIRLWFTAVLIFGLLLGSPGAFAKKVVVGGWDEPGWDAYTIRDYEGAIAAWMAFGEQTDASTLIRIGWMYRYGEGLEVDHQKASVYFTKAARAGHPWSQFNLADLYADGGGNFTQDLEKAYMWYLLAQKGGFERTNTRLVKISKMMTADQIARATKAAAESPYQPRKSEDKILAKTLRDAKNMFQREYMRERNRVVGVRRFSNGAETTRTAGEILDEWYEIFIGIPSYMMDVLETQKERRWTTIDKDITKKAPENVSIAKYYQYGEELEAKYTEAAIKFEKAALKGDPSSAANLGFLYFFGNGVPIDILKAHLWFNLAAKGGVSRAHFLMAQVEDRMTPEQIEAANLMADEKITQLPES
ncbi:MAG TPA: sel1 repeat family protein [Sneathiellales bacterium]|nr:sel1 repeat family protein [Sneathiellales bacterium]